MEYIFILGRQPALSLAEILAVLKQQKNLYKIIFFGKEILMIDVEKTIDVDFLIQRLGGTIKIGHLKERIDSTKKPWKKELKMKILSLIKGKIKNGIGKKIYFGLSNYAQRPKNEIHEIGLEIKKELAGEGIKSRFVISREAILSSVVVKTNKLLSERGLEIIVGQNGDQVWLGQTLTVQPFEELSERDYGRPGRDAFSGMLPPKLAKMMVNLAETDQKTAILDPFCGSGTILTEAAMMGYQNLFGSDANSKAIEDTKKNLLWLKQKYPISNIQYLISNLKQCDICRLSRYFQPRSIDVVITEPYLGPPLKGRETPEQINKIIREMSSLYLNALKEIRQVLKLNGRIIMIWPIFNQNKFLPLENEIKKIGFQIEPLLPASFASLLTPRGTLIYARPGQRVGREIMRLRPKTTLGEGCSCDGEQRSRTASAEKRTN